jgi:hypothetical protein
MAFELLRQSALRADSIVLRRAPGRHPTSFAVVSALLHERRALEKAKDGLNHRSAFLVLLLAACGDADASDAGSKDAAREREGDAGGAPMLPTSDAGGVSGEPEVVSSLALEQVWFLTGSNTEILIDFRQTPPLVTCGGSVGSADGFEGTGVFTDPKTGELLFYTDGRTVFNGRTNVALANGTGLLGDPSAGEPALITPANTGSNDEFYIFTNDTNVSSPSSIYFSLIDLSLGPDGTVTKKNQLLLHGNPGEALDVVPHTNGKDFWVLAYDGAATVKAFLVTANGVATSPVVSATRLTGAVARSSINHTLDYDHLALSIHYGLGKGTIATATIDRSSGEVSTAKTIVTGDLGYHASYSADGTKLYYVRGQEGWNGIAYQYDLTESQETKLGGSGMAAAKLAPNGKVYWAGRGHKFMGVVSQPDVAGTGCGFVEHGLDLGGCSVAFGVPNQTAAFLEYLPPAPK